MYLAHQNGGSPGSFAVARQVTISSGAIRRMSRATSIIAMLWIAGYAGTGGDCARGVRAPRPLRGPILYFPQAESLALSHASHLPLR
jgi:hypothetical protein